MPVDYSVLLQDDNTEASLDAHSKTLVDEGIVLSTALAVNKQQDHTLDLEYSNVPNVANTTVAIEALIENISTTNANYGFFKTSMESLCEPYGVEASVLPSIGSFNKNPTLGTQVSLEGAVSFLGGVFESILEFIKKIIKSILNLITDIWNWVRNFFGHSVAKTKVMVQQAPNVKVNTKPNPAVLAIKTTDGAQQYDHTGNNYVLRIPNHVAKLLWDNKTKSVSSDIVKDLEHLNMAFAASFLKELHYRANTDVSYFTNKLKAIQHFTFPTDVEGKSVKYSDNDETIMRLEAQLADNKERKDYIENTVNVYKSSNSEGMYIGGLTLDLSNDFAVFKDSPLDFDDSKVYTIKALDKHELEYITKILDMIKNEFSNLSLVEEVTNKYLKLCDEFEHSLSKLKGRLGNNNKLSVEAKKRIALVNKLFSKDLQEMRSSINDFRNHSIKVTAHLTKVAHSVHKDLVIPNTKLLGHIADNNA